MLLSTLFSPLTTPLAFDLAAWFAPAGTDGVLNQLTGAGVAGVFVVAWVVLPMTLGLVSRWLIGGTRADSHWTCHESHDVGGVSGVVLRKRFGVLTGRGCRSGLGFPLAAGGGCGRVDVRDAHSQPGLESRRGGGGPTRRRASLVFGIGMANNGAGLALAAGRWLVVRWHCCRWLQ